jgi:hypothetical protein
MTRQTIALLLAGFAMAISPAHADPLATDRLMADVARYESFGLHRYGSPAAAGALDWIAGELAAAGLTVTQQRFTLERQYVFESGALTVGRRQIDVLPQWWSPPDKASFDLSAPIGPQGLLHLKVPYDRGAYLTDGHRAKLAEAFAAKPQAVLLEIGHPSGEIFTYNVDPANAPWPVPVLLVAPKDSAALTPGRAATLSVRGAYRHDVEGRNIVARLDRGRGKWLVVSTPVTSWFTSTCERGPGIAGFLAMARLAKETFTEHDLVFVATSGHEIGHGGMEHFMHAGAPKPAATALWAHFGASLACADPVVRVILSSDAALVERTFTGIEGMRLVADKAAVGELRDVHAAGYPTFFGMAGAHKFFHTPKDNLAAVNPDSLGPVVKAFAETLRAAR